MKSKLTTFTVSLAFATAGFANSGSGASGAPLPPLKTQGAVSYVTGGIGERESTALKHAAAHYPLELLFTEKTQRKDAYIAGVRVMIRDRSGTALLDTKADGPFLLAKLPAGKYRIDAEYAGMRKHQTVEIHPGKHQRAVFVWASRGQRKSPVVTSAR